MSKTRIGISGWRYKPWRGDFYPTGLQQDRELEYASRIFSTIEINGTFYSLQRPESFKRWHEETPSGFVFSVKGNRYITHIRRLREIEAPLANFFASGIFHLGEKLGPILWQFPPSFRYEFERMKYFFELLPRDTEQALSLARHRERRMTGRARLAIDVARPLRHAIEIRHESSWTNPTSSCANITCPGLLRIRRGNGHIGKMLPRTSFICACTETKSFMQAVIPRRLFPAGPRAYGAGAKDFSPRTLTS